MADIWYYDILCFTVNSKMAAVLLGKLLEEEADPEVELEIESANCKCNESYPWTPPEITIEIIFAEDQICECI